MSTNTAGLASRNCRGLTAFRNLSNRAVNINALNPLGVVRVEEGK